MKLQETVEAAEPALKTSASGRLWYENYLLERMDDVKASLMVATNGGLRVGYVLAQLQQRPTLADRYSGLLAEVVVHPDWRRQGIGRKLVDAELGWLRKQGIHRVEVQVLDGNPEAGAFWESMGFAGYLRTLGRGL
jgi:GNAT superfamily N-acetyltransferase